jgi:hypothetical protein
LANYGSLELIEVSTDWTPHPAEDSAAWGDTVGVFRQAPMGLAMQWRRRAMQVLRKLLLPGYR